MNFQNFIRGYPYRYCGKERDEESVMYYYGARYYLPWTCRFVSVDPLATKYPYLTPYNYAGNRPITHKDIDGMQSTGDTPVNNSSSTQQPQSGGDSKDSQSKINIDNISKDYKVAKGDTISGLAQKNNVSEQQIRNLNPQTQNRKQTDQINIGENLKIPLVG